MFGAKRITRHSGANSVGGGGERTSPPPPHTSSLELLSPPVPRGQTELSQLGNSPLAQWWGNWPRRRAVMISGSLEGCIGLGPSSGARRVWRGQRVLPSGRWEGHPPFSVVSMIAIGFEDCILLRSSEADNQLNCICGPGQYLAAAGTPRPRHCFVVVCYVFCKVLIPPTHCCPFSSVERKLPQNKFQRLFCVCVTIPASSTALVNLCGVNSKYMYVCVCMGVWECVNMCVYTHTPILCKAGGNTVPISIQLIFSKVLPHAKYC